MALKDDADFIRGYFNPPVLHGRSTFWTHVILGLSINGHFYSFLLTFSSFICLNKCLSKLSHSKLKKICIIFRCYIGEERYLIFNFKMSWIREIFIFCRLSKDEKSRVDKIWKILEDSNKRSKILHIISDIYILKEMN